MKSAPLIVFPALLLHAFAAEAPRKVDQDLRARVNDFYTLIIQHKTRAAEALVAEDTRDYYYDSQKPDMESFEIDKITYGPSYKTAEVTIAAKMHMFFPGAGPQTVPMKFPSTWKIDHGKWCWHIDKARLADTPFGTLHPGPDANGSSKQIVTPGMLAAAVRPERNQISVDITGKEQTTINFSNSLPGPVTLHAPSDIKLKIQIATATIPAGKSTAVTFQADPDGSRPETITFTVEPTGQKIPIQIIYSVNNR